MSGSLRLRFDDGILNIIIIIIITHLVIVAI